MLRVASNFLDKLRLAERSLRNLGTSLEIRKVGLVNVRKSKSWKVIEPAERGHGGRATHKLGPQILEALRGDGAKDSSPRRRGDSVYTSSETGPGRHICGRRAAH